MTKPFPWGELTDLNEGRVHRVIVEVSNGDELAYEWKGAFRPRLFWSAKKSALLWWSLGKAPKKTKTGKPKKTSAAAKAYKAWNGKQPAEGYTFAIPVLELELVGKARRIYYSSKKYKDGQMRHHDFGGWVKLRSARAGGFQAFEVRGGQLSITSGGIHG